jgi:hypothetical protein
VDNVNNILKKVVMGQDTRKQNDLDALMIAADGTKNKSALGYVIFPVFFLLLLYIFGISSCLSFGYYDATFSIFLSLLLCMLVFLLLGPTQSWVCPSLLHVLVPLQRESLSTATSERSLGTRTSLCFRCPPST